MKVLIVGGGIGGLSAALALRREGVEAEVFEQAPALLEVGAAIAVWPNAMRVLQRLGVADAVLARAGQFRRVRWMSQDGTVLNHSTFPETGAAAVALHRADLQGALVGALPPESVHLGKTFVSFREVKDEVRVSFDDRSKVWCEVLVGADGLHSRLREQLFYEGPPVYRGYTVWRGITRLEHPALSTDTAVEVFGRGKRFGIGPVGLGRTGWWATANEPSGVGEPPSERREKLLRLFGGWCAPVTELIEATESEAIIRSPTYDRPPCARWGERQLTLLGDAAHPTTPNFGQGGCMAIEDAAVLARYLGGSDYTHRALRAYEARRRARTARITRYSRLYGAVGQWQNAAAVRLRASLLSAVPESLLRRLLRLIFDHDAYAAEA